MPRYDTRDAAGRFVAIAGPPQAHGAEGGEAALREFIDAVRASAESLEELSTKTLEETAVKEESKKQSFLSLGKGKMMFAAFVGAGWKAVRWLNAWSKESAASIERMQNASKRFATVIGKSTTEDRLRAAEEKFKAAEKQWKERGGPSTQENLPWWARWPGALKEALGMTSDAQKLKMSRIEMEGAKKLRDYLKGLNLPGGRKATMYALFELTKEQNRIATQIEANTAALVAAVTRLFIDLPRPTLRSTLTN